MCDLNTCNYLEVCNCMTRAGLCSHSVCSDLKSEAQIVLTHWRAKKNISYSVPVSVSAAGCLSITISWDCIFFLLDLCLNFTCISNIFLNSDTEFHKRSSLEHTAGEMQETQTAYQSCSVKVPVWFSVFYRQQYIIVKLSKTNMGIKYSSQSA